MEPETLAVPAAEIACIGSALLDAQAVSILVASLTPADFFYDKYRALFLAISTLAKKEIPIDRLTLYEELQRQELTHHATAQDILTVEEQVPTAAHVSHYAQMVADASLRRRVRHAADLLAQSLRDGDLPTTDSLAAFTASVESSLRQSGVRGTPTVEVPRPVGVVLQSWMRRFDEAPPKRIPLPYPSLTRRLGGGFGPGELHVLGARRKVGKSAMAGAIATHAARSGCGVLVVSREMVVEALVGRMVSQASRIPASRLRSGTVDQREWAILAHTYQALYNLPLWLTDSLVSIDDIEGMVDRWAESVPLSLLIVDYLQLVRSHAGVKDRRLQVDDVSASLKGLAMRRKIPVLVLSSIRRPTEVAASGKEARPTLADLKESGNIEHDADVVVLLHRQVMEQETTCILAAQREGPTGEIFMVYKGETLTFEEVETVSVP